MAACELKKRVTDDLTKMIKLAGDYKLDFNYSIDEVYFEFSGPKLAEFLTEINKPGTTFNNLNYELTDRLIVKFPRNYFKEKAEAGNYVKYTFDIVKNSKGEYWFMGGKYSTLEGAQSALNSYFKLLDASYSTNNDRIWEKYYNFKLSAPLTIQLKELTDPILAYEKGYRHKIGKDYVLVNAVKQVGGLSYTELKEKLGVSDEVLDNLLVDLTPKQLAEFKAGKRFQVYTTLKGNKLITTLSGKKILTMAANPNLSIFNKALDMLERRTSQLKMLSKNIEDEDITEFSTEFKNVFDKTETIIKKLDDYSNIDEILQQLQSDQDYLYNLLENTKSKEIGEYVVRTLKGYARLIQDISPEVKAEYKTQLDSFATFYDDIMKLIPAKEQEYLTTLYEELQTPTGELVQGEDVDGISSVIKVATDSRNKLIQLVGKLTLKINALVKKKYSEYQLRMNPIRKELGKVKDRKAFFKQFQQKHGKLLTGNLIVKESYDYFLKKLISSNFRDSHTDYIETLLKNEDIKLNGSLTEMQKDVDTYFEKIARTKFEAPISTATLFSKILTKIETDWLEDAPSNHFRTVLTAYYKYMYDKYQPADLTFDGTNYGGKMVADIESGLKGDEQFIVNLFKKNKVSITAADLELFSQDLADKMIENLGYHDRLTDYKAKMDLQKFYDYFNELKEKKIYNGKKFDYLVDFYQNTYMFKIGGVSAFDFELMNSDFYDKDWVVLMSKPADSIERRFYDKMVAELKDAKVNSKVGYSVEWNRIPEYYAESRKEDELVKEYAKRKLDRTIMTNTTNQVSTNEKINPLTGKLQKMLHFNRLVDRRRVTPTGDNLADIQDKIKDKEWDLEKVLDNYILDVNNYIYKKAYEDHINLIVEVGSNQEVLMRRADGSIVRSFGEAQYEKSRRVAEQLEYIRDAYIYGEAHAIEGKEMMSGTNEFLQKLVNKKVIRKVQGRVVSKEDEVKLNELYGKIEVESPEDEKLVRNSFDDPEFEYLSLTENQKSYYKIVKFERTLPFATGNKFINWLNKFTSYRMIAFNPFSALAEFLQFSSTAFIEGYAGEFFSIKDMEKAFKEGITIKNDVSKSDKLILMQHFFRTEADTGVIESSFGKIGFAGFRWINKIQDIILGIAICNKEKINGHSLYDLMKVENGQLVIEGFTPEESEEKLLQMQAKFVEFIRIKRNRTDVHPTQFNKNSLLRLAGLFKYNWMVDGFYNRFQDKSTSAILGEREGYYRTFVKALQDRVETEDGVEYRTNWLKVPLRLLSVPLKVNFGKYDYSNLSEHEIANIRRSVFELEMVVLITTALFFLLGGDDDDEDMMPKAVMNFLVNSMVRLQRDNLTFTDPDSFVSIIKNPIPAASTLTDMVDVIEAGLSTMFFDPYVGETEQLKLGKEGFELLPILNVPKKINNKLNEITNYEQ
jgi:hypothetical protein